MKYYTADEVREMLVKKIAALNDQNGRGGVTALAAKMKLSKQYLSGVVLGRPVSPAMLKHLGLKRKVVYERKPV